MCVSDTSRQMSLPLNSLHQEPQSYSPEQPNRLEGRRDEWPDWSNPEENENRDGQPVQIHIQASERGDSVGSRLPLSHGNMEEEPWEDFEDTEPTSDLSPTAHLTDPVVLPPSRGPATTSVKHAPEALRSKPLKLTSTLRQSTQSKTTSSWNDAWAQEETDSEKPHNPLNSKSKPVVPQVVVGKGLGEEFTIKVKKKVHQDPELDLFADMVPDIKLSSTTLLPLEESRESTTRLSSVNTGPLQINPSINNLTLTAKFAAANLTEVDLFFIIIIIKSNTYLDLQL